MRIIIAFILGFVLATAAAVVAVERPPRRDPETANVEQYLVDALINVGDRKKLWNKKEVLEEARKLQNEDNFKPVITPSLPIQARGGAGKDK
jgi:hypothetical protein